MAADNGGFRDAFGELARARGIELAGGATAAADASLATLRDVAGEAFDRAFLARQLGLYPAMAELFQSMASNSPDPGLQRLGIAVLATLRRQFDTARALGAPMGLRAETVENPPQY